MKTHVKILSTVAGKPLSTLFIYQISFFLPGNKEIKSRKYSALFSYLRSDLFHDSEFLSYLKTV